MFTWNGENNTESVGYKMKKKATIPKTTAWCPLLSHFLPGNNIRPQSKRDNNNDDNNNDNNNNNSNKSNERIQKFSLAYLDGWQCWKRFFSFSLS